MFDPRLIEPLDVPPTPSWWHRQNRPYDRAELLADAVVHAVGLLVAVVAGAALLWFAATATAPEHVPTLSLYVLSLLAVLSVSLAFNQCPPCSLKMHLAKADQASIFLFMAGSYTPFLTLVSDTTTAGVMLAAVWGMSLVGIALKVLVPHRFGRVAILLYLAIGWSGLLVFRNLAETIPSTALWLLVAGGVVYSLGIVFHLWERLRFQNALWHVAVVIGATLHLVAVLDCMVLSRLD